MEYTHNINRKFKGNLIKNSLIGFGMLYFLSCLPNSIKLNNELINPLRERFRTEAKSGYKIKLVYDPEQGSRRALDYEDKLTKILDKRDTALRENYGLQVLNWPWSVNGYYSSKDKFEVDARANTPVFCYNPFYKIPPNK